MLGSAHGILPNYWPRNNLRSVRWAREVDYLNYPEYRTVLGQATSGTPMWSYLAFAASPPIIHTTWWTTPEEMTNSPAASSETSVSLTPQNFRRRPLAGQLLDPETIPLYLS